jgi:hypothetical protein
MRWSGPYRIDKLLDNLETRPPEAHSVYLISKKRWNGQPTAKCIPLYVGSNTGKSGRFRTRVGDLIADMFGFFGSETGHHSGGQTLHSHCMEHGLKPTKLYIGWLTQSDCERCDETEVYQKFKPYLLNKNHPTICRQHCGTMCGRRPSDNTL